MNNQITLANQFYFNLPSDFVPVELEERYAEMLGSKRKLFPRVIDFINSTCLSLTFPSITFPTVSNPQNLRRKKIKWKTVGNIYDLFDDTITITFQNVDSNLNYLILLDILTGHYQNVDEAFDQPIIITFIDENRSALYHVQFRSVIWTGLSENILAFNDPTIATKQFTMSFTYNFIDFQYVKDKIDLISNNTY
jgi:hypothetical protein